MDQGLVSSALFDLGMVSFHLSVILEQRPKAVYVVSPGQEG